MDIDDAAGRISHDHADRLIASVQQMGLNIAWIIETHSSDSAPNATLSLPCLA